MKSNLKWHKLDKAFLGGKTKQHQDYQVGNLQEMVRKVKKKQKMMTSQKQVQRKVEGCQQIKTKIYSLEEVDKILNQEIKMFKD